MNAPSDLAATDITAAPAALDAALAATRDLRQRMRLLDVLARSLDMRAVFTTSLGIEDQVILDAIAAAAPSIELATLDTGRLFPETLDTLEASQRRYGRPIRVLVPDARETEELVARDGAMGFRVSVENRVACCEVRKVRPLARALAGAGIWITGLRRSQSEGRGHVPLAAIDAATGLIKVSPLADWALADVEAYARLNAVPLNPLHAKGFPSIGCQTCTRAIKPGEDIRAGRWWWESQDGKECGLHKSPHRRTIEENAKTGAGA